ncbi:MAG: hypothetical protein ABSF71_27915 [Terriglobia bacterium]|jgi:hypothetical protein
MIEIIPMELPQFGGLEESLPPIPLSTYEERLAAAVGRMKKAHLDFLLVYADREHFANMSFLTGFDPRFEEALLLLDRTGRRWLLVGNECMGYLPDAGLKCEPILFQEFSLMGQPRGDSRSLRAVLADFGIAQGAWVGCAGWKYFEGPLVDNPGSAIEIPAYIVDLLRSLVGDAEKIRNAGGLFMNPQDGLRVINSADQIAQFEFASIRTSESVLSVVRSVREGVAENELEKLLQSSGLPFSCHPIVSFGEKVKRGLSSPSARRARLGDAFVVGFGVQGALNCRAGAVAHGPEDLPAELREFYPRLAANYFEVVACWYESLRIGARGGDVWQRVDSMRDDARYSFAVNPGHYLHLDEWVHSPFSPGSNVLLRSGMALQADIIPVSRGPFCYINAEDGIVLADEKLRAELASRFPACWRRIEKRRAFMKEVVGIRLHEDVLPLSNTPGWLAPYVLEPAKAFVYAGRPTASS